MGAHKLAKVSFVFASLLMMVNGAPSAWAGDTAKLNTIYASITSPGKDSAAPASTRYNAYTDLEKYVGQYGVPDQVPANIYSALEQDLTQKLFDYSQNAARVLVLIGSPTSPFAGQVTDLFLLNNLFSFRTSETVTAATLNAENPTTLQIIAPLRTPTAESQYFSLLKERAEAFAQYLYQSSVSTDKTFNSASYAPVQAADERITQFLKSFDSAVEPGLQQVVSYRFPRSPNDFQVLSRALEISAALGFDDANFLERYLEIIESGMPLLKITKRAETQAALVQAKELAAENILRIAPTDNAVVQRIMNAPQDAWQSGNPSRSTVLFAIAQKGSALATEGLAQELLDYATHTVSRNDNFSQIDTYVARLSQLKLDSRAQQIVKQALTIPEVQQASGWPAGANTLQKQILPADALGNIIDPQAVRVLLEKYPDNEVIVTHLLSERIYADNDSEIPEVEKQKTDLGLTLKEVILKRLSPSNTDIIALKNAGLAIDAAIHFNLGPDSQVQTAIATLTHLPGSFSEKDGPAILAQETHDLNNHALGALTKISPDKLTENTLLEVLKTRNDLSTTALNLLNNSKTSSVAVQEALLARLQKNPPSYVGTDPRLALINTLSHLTITDPTIKNLARAVLSGNSKLQDIARFNGKNLLVAAGLAADPTSMATVEQIAAHAKQYPNDFVYLTSVIDQVHYLNVPNDKVGVANAIIPALRNYLATPPLNTEMDFSHLTLALDFIAEVKVVDSQVVTLVAKWAQKNSLSLFDRWIRFSGAAKNVRTTALAVLGDSNSDSPSIAQVLTDAVHDSDEVIRRVALEALEKLEKNGHLVTKAAANDPNLRSQLESALTSRRVQKMNAAHYCPSLLEDFLPHEI